MNGYDPFAGAGGWQNTPDPGPHDADQYPWENDPWTGAAGEAPAADALPPAGLAPSSEPEPWDAPIVDLYSPPVTSSGDEAPEAAADPVPSTGTEDAAEPKVAEPVSEDVKDGNASEGDSADEAEPEPEPLPLPNDEMESFIANYLSDPPPADKPAQKPQKPAQTAEDAPRESTPPDPAPARQEPPQAPPARQEPAPTTAPAPAPAPQQRDVADATGPAVASRVANEGKRPSLPNAASLPPWPVQADAYELWETEQDAAAEAADLVDLDAVNRELTRLRLQLIKARRAVKTRARARIAAETAYGRALRRSKLTVSAKTVSEREAYAEVECEQQENEHLLAKTLHEEALSMMRTTRDEIEAVTAVANNLRAELNLARG